MALGVILGMLLALAVGYSRLVLHAHSISETVLGLLVGGGASLAFLYNYRASWCLPERVYVALLSLLLVLPLVYGHRFPSEALLADIAHQLSGHPAYVRRVRAIRASSCVILATQVLPPKTEVR